MNDAPEEVRCFCQDVICGREILLITPLHFSQNEVPEHFTKIQSWFFVDSSVSKLTFIRVENMEELVFEFKIENLTRVCGGTELPVLFEKLNAFLREDERQRCVLIQYDLDSASKWLCFLAMSRREQNLFYNALTWLYNDKHATDMFLSNLRTVKPSVARTFHPCPRPYIATTEFVW